MSRALRSACLVAFVSVVAVLSMPGCSQQGQGERCESINGNADCNDGLTCVPAGKLAVQTADRCCPAETTETDSRCQRLGGSGNVGGSGGGGTGGSGGGGTSAAGESSGGMSSTSEIGGAAATPGGAPSSSAGMPATTAGAASAAAGADGAP